MTLQDFFASNPKAALAFSGGVDSTYLLYAARQLGADVRPYYVRSAFQPDFALADVRRFASMIGVEPTVLELDVLAIPGISENPEDRCYLCKSAMLRTLRDRASADGYPVLLDGTNASDEAGDRPGMRALRELGVQSPLRLAGLTKAEIRRLSEAAGLPSWKLPAYACLATRIPTGDRITEPLLRCVDAAETALRELGLDDFRVRVFHGAARLQLHEAELQRMPELRTAILSALNPFFSDILLDLEVR